MSFFRFKSALLLSNTLIRLRLLDVGVGAMVVLVSFPLLRTPILLLSPVLLDTIRLLSRGKKRIPWRTKVILRWHKWPARSACDKRRILMEKSLCLFVRFLQVNCRAASVTTTHAHWIMHYSFVKNECNSHTSKAIHCIEWLTNFLKNCMQNRTKWNK